MSDTFAPGPRMRARALYDQMVVITIAPDWAKLLDFETTLPNAAEDEDLVPARHPARQFECSINTRLHAIPYLRRYILLTIDNDLTQIYIDLTFPS